MCIILNTIFLSSVHTASGSTLIHRSCLPSTVYLPEFPPTPLHMIAPTTAVVTLSSWLYFFVTQSYFFVDLLRSLLTTPWILICLPPAPTQPPGPLSLVLLGFSSSLLHHLCFLQMNSTSLSNPPCLSPGSSISLYI